MSTATPSTVNVGLRLRGIADLDPEGVAVAQPLLRNRSWNLRSPVFSGKWQLEALARTGAKIGLSSLARQVSKSAQHQSKRSRKRQYKQITFRELEADTNRIANGLRSMGVQPGMRLVLLVPPGIDFVALVFALLKTGAVMVLVDPGMGREYLLKCLEECQPEGFIAVPKVQAVRTVMRRRFRKARFNVTVGGWAMWGGCSLTALRRAGGNESFQVSTQADDPAAIIFTSGSTGLPKGVLYQHRNFDWQVVQIRDQYKIQPGEIDLPGFPLFALFNAAMGVTTVFPDMDFTRPASADPRNIVEAANDWQVTQAFGSPALWNVVGRYCEEERVTLRTLRRVLSAGAPVPPHVLERMRKAIHGAGEIHTPYGATEALPVASISADEVLEGTADRSAQGAGTCVGQRFPGIHWKVIRICDEPIMRIEQVDEVPSGEIGELIVRGPVVTSQYVTSLKANAAHKIQDRETFWHRMGDVGYLDHADRFWFCGRKSQRVLHSLGTMFTEPVETIINQHSAVYRSALVGVGAKGRQRAVVVVETWPEARPSSRQAEEQLIAELLELARSHELTQAVSNILLHPALPVDTRHNSKIFREQLAVWAGERVEVE